MRIKKNRYILLLVNIILFTIVRGEMFVKSQSTVDLYTLEGFKTCESEEYVFLTYRRLLDTNFQIKERANFTIQVLRVSKYNGSIVQKELSFQAESNLLPISIRFFDTSLYVICLSDNDKINFKNTIVFELDRDLEVKDIWYFDGKIINDLSIINNEIFTIETLNAQLSRFYPVFIGHYSKKFSKLSQSRFIEFSNRFSSSFGGSTYSYQLWNTESEGMRVYSANNEHISEYSFFNDSVSKKEFYGVPNGKIISLNPHDGGLNFIMLSGFIGELYDSVGVYNLDRKTQSISLLAETRLEIPFIYSIQLNQLPKCIVLVLGGLGESERITIYEKDRKISSNRHKKGLLYYSLDMNVQIYIQEVHVDKVRKFQLIAEML